MSLYAANAFGYLQQVEAYFLSQTRVGVMLSSKDAELMRHYRDTHVPVEVVCLGIQRAFKTFDEAPRSIYQCRHAIEHEVHAWRARQVGRHVQADASSATLRSAAAPALAAALPGRDLPDPTDPNRRLRRSRRPPPPGDTPQARPQRPQRPEPEALPPIPIAGGQELTATREPWLEPWYRSMARLMELGRGCEDEHITRCYRWAWKEMQHLRLEALDEADRERAASVLPLAIGEIEAAMYDQLYNSLHPDLRVELDTRLPPQMHRALKAMSAPAAHRQLRVWRRRMLEELLAVKPFYTP